MAKPKVPHTISDKKMASLQRRAEQNGKPRTAAQMRHTMRAVSKWRSN